MCNQLFGSSFINSGRKLDSKVLAISGLILSIWVHYLTIIYWRIYDYASGRYPDDSFIRTTLNSYLILSVAISLGLLWGVERSVPEFLKIWVGFKIFECCAVLIRIVINVAIVRHLTIVPFGILILVSQVYLLLSSKKLYDSKFGNIVKEKNNEAILQNVA